MLATCASQYACMQVRMQSEGKLPPNVPKKYPSALAAYGIIARKEGFFKLWTGVVPNVARNAIINAAELASYDQARLTNRCLYTQWHATRLLMPAIGVVKLTGTVCVVLRSVQQQYNIVYVMIVTCTLAVDGDELAKGTLKSVIRM